MAETPKVIHADASPQKEFFINMITKDILLADCIFDLLDNCVDGANTEIKKTKRRVKDEKRYEGYQSSINFDGDSFTIADNCGGIPIDIAEKYAFNFGRSKSAPQLPEHSIGLYGIGMKRAIFKIGKKVNIESYTEKESFKTEIDVPVWAQKTDKDGKWSFDLSTGPGNDRRGTIISIPVLTDEAKVELGNPEFLRDLRETIARDYAIILMKGFTINVNDVPIAPQSIYILNTEGFKPVRFEKDLKTKTKKVVKFQIIAGLWGAPDPEDTETTAEEPDPGWYVICNDRIILAGDKTYRTGWGTYIKRKWHSQYKPFIGLAIFNSDDPALLPWNTTKRGVDLNSEVYMQALVSMADVTDAAIDYSNKRKVDQDVAKDLEGKATAIPIFTVPLRKTMSFPPIAEKESRIKMANVSYRVPEEDLVKVKEALGDADMKNKDAGEQTFQYFYMREVE